MPIETYEFSEEGREALKSGPKGTNWPVVYIISGDREAYIGETCSMSTRMGQHLANEERRKLTTISVIVDEKFNKSAVLDLEQSLIQLCGADGRFKLQNLNSGQSSRHDYYQRELYANRLPGIWRDLVDRGLAVHGLDEIRNSDLFKYSPYTTLTPEQREVSSDVMRDVIETLSEGGRAASVIHGSAGTGKTVLAMSMVFTLVNASRTGTDPAASIEGFTDEQLSIHELYEFVKNLGRPLKIGFVVPMYSIRKTLSKVFKATGNGLRGRTVIGPSDASKDHFDILFVDESHRLSKRKNIVNMKAFDDACARLGMDKFAANQLDWIVASSDYQVLFYDETQSVRGSDITPEEFENSLPDRVQHHTLTCQLRCNAGDDYPHYVERILSCRQAHREDVQGYDLRMFDDVDEMVQAIRALDKEIGLCRNVAGYGWEWNTKGMAPEDIRAKGLYDIEIGPHKYVWNISNEEWILRPESVDEIGCVHTTQGYDLNYVGVIFGPEIDYDETTGTIVVDPSKFFDVNAKKQSSDEEIHANALNAYKVLMTRGIRGCFVYACNDGLKGYLKRFFDFETESD